MVQANFQKIIIIATLIVLPIISACGQDPNQNASQDEKEIAKKVDEYFIQVDLKPVDDVSAEVSNEGSTEDAKAQEAADICNDEKGCDQNIQNVEVTPS